MGVGAFCPAAALALAALAGCTPCPKISQDVTVLEADETLRPLLEACQSNVPPAGVTCPPESPDRPAPALRCACVPLCQRVLQIVDQFQGPEALEACWLFPPPEGGTGSGIVRLHYRPSTCE